MFSRASLQCSASPLQLHTMVHHCFPSLGSLKKQALTALPTRPTLYPSRSRSILLRRARSYHECIVRILSHPSIAAIGASGGPRVSAARSVVSLRGRRSRPSDRIAVVVRASPRRAPLFPLVPCVVFVLGVAACGGAAEQQGRRAGAHLACASCLVCPASPVPLRFLLSPLPPRHMTTTN